MIDIPITAEDARALERGASLLPIPTDKCPPDLEPNSMVRFICPDENYFIRNVREISYDGKGIMLEFNRHTHTEDKPGPGHYITVETLRRVVARIPKDDKHDTWKFRAPEPAPNYYHAVARIDDRFDCTLAAVYVDMGAGIRIKAWRYKNIVIIP